MRKVFLNTFFSVMLIHSGLQQEADVFLAFRDNQYIVWIVYVSALP